MFGPFKKKMTRLEGLIDVLESEMQTSGPEDPQYNTYMEKLERLYKLKATSPKARISRDQALLVAGNLAGILIIVAYEQKHVFGSKGQSFLLKTK